MGLTQQPYSETSVVYHGILLEGTIERATVIQGLCQYFCPKGAILTLGYCSLSDTPTPIPQAFICLVSSVQALAGSGLPLPVYPHTA